MPNSFIAPGLFLFTTLIIVRYMTGRIILASGSPQRRALLNQIGVSFRVHAVNTDESPGLNESPRCYVERVAAQKSAACRLETGSELPVLAADTAVVVAGRILGKPSDYVHAVAMLEALSGRTHQVYSAVSVLGRCQALAVNISEVTFNTLTRADIEAYWLTGEPRDKAGAYAIQGLAALFIRSIRGSYSGVMGLPLFETSQLLQKQGINLLHE